jgi:DNA-binding winged helix-turn-helix (wHTH) protein/tetratricopeptide (TPR) repeat protein
MGTATLNDFGPFRLDAANHVLLRDGRPVPLKPKAFDTLLLLVENGGRVVSKQDLLERLWPDTIVEEASLTQNVYEVRKALGAEHDYIENVPKRGYRFTADVRPAAVAPATSIAVLPLRSLGNTGGDEHLELGIADALITVLTNLRRLVVRPTSAVVRYAGGPQDALAAGRELNVRVVVDGTVQTSDDRVRVTVRLLEVASGAALWAGKFDEKMTDIFTVQDSIAERVAAAIGPELGERERGAVTRHYTESGEAYQLYLKGRYNWNKVTQEGLRKALDFFRAAIAVDPRYALAWVGIADAYTSLDWYGVLSTRESNPQAMAAARRAIEIDDTLAEAHASLAMARQYAWDWTGAEEEYRTALALNPNYAPAQQWYGVFLAFMGRFDEALAHIRRAGELDPVSLSIASQIGLVLLIARRYAEADEELRKALEVDAASVEARFYVGMLRTLQGRYAEAIEILRDLPPENPDFRAMLATAWGLSGSRDEASAIIDELSASKDGYVPPLWLAIAYLGLGDSEQVLTCLERACDDPDDSLLAVGVFPMFDPVREHPRFRAVLGRMGLTV